MPEVSYTSIRHGLLSCLTALALLGATLPECLATSMIGKRAVSECEESVHFVLPATINVDEISRRWDIGQQALNVQKRDLTAGKYTFYPDSSVANHGVTTTGSLKDILTSIGTSTKATVVFLHSSASSTTSYAVSTTYDASLYSNCTFVFERGALLSVATGVTLTLPNAANVNVQQTQQWISLTGTGKVTFSTGGATMYPQWWGCTADGSTDDSKPFAAMLSAKPNYFTPIDLGARTYRIDSELALPDKIKIFNGRIDFSNAGANTKLFTCKGSLGTALSLTGNATTGDTSVTLSEADAATLSEGDYIWIESATIWCADTSGTQGEQHRVKSVSGTTVYLYDALICSYLTADTAKVTKFAFKEDIEFDSFRAGGNGTSNQHVAWFTYCRNVNIHNCETSKFYQTHWRFATCREFSVTNCRIFHAANPNNGYGICASEGSQFYHLDHNYGEYCRQLVEAGAGTRGVNRYWTANFNEVVGAFGDGVSTHGNAELGEIRGNRINAGIGSDADSLGIFVRGINIIVEGNQIIGPNMYGIYYVPIASEHTGTRRGYVQVTNNTIDYPRHKGIYVYFTENEVYRHISICGNSIYNLKGGIGIHLRADTGVVRGFQISNNTVSDLSGKYECLRVEAYDAGNISAGSIIGNTFHRNDDATSNIKLIGNATNALTFVSVIGNTIWNGSEGIKGTNTNYNTILGNIFSNISGDNTSTIGANSIEDHNVMPDRRLKQPF